MPRKAKKLGIDANVPGFNAEASIYVTKTRYSGGRILGKTGVRPLLAGVIPQLKVEYYYGLDCSSGTDCVPYIWKVVITD